jgi:hypothetical protein
MISIPIIYGMETLENELTQSFFHLQQRKQGKMVLVIQPEITIALLTDALFSDAGWGAFGFGAA